MGPLRFRSENPTKPTYAKRITKEEWAEHEALIRTLHGEQYSRQAILEVLRKQQFRPSIGQLNAKMKSWDLRVYKVDHPLPTDTLQANAAPQDFAEPITCESNPEVHSCTHIARKSRLQHTRDARKLSPLSEHPCWETTKFVPQLSTESAGYSFYELDTRLIDPSTSSETSELEVVPQRKSTKNIAVILTDYYRPSPEVTNADLRNQQNFGPVNKSTQICKDQSNRQSIVEYQPTAKILRRWPGLLKQDFLSVYGDLFEMLRVAQFLSAVEIPIDAFDVYYCLHRCVKRFYGLLHPLLIEAIIGCAKTYVTKSQRLCTESILNASLKTLEHLELSKSPIASHFHLHLADICQIETESSLNFSRAAEIAIGSGTDLALSESCSSKLDYLMMVEKLENHLSQLTLFPSQQFGFANPYRHFMFCRLVTHCLSRILTRYRHVVNESSQLWQSLSAHVNNGGGEAAASLMISTWLLLKWLTSPAHELPGNPMDSCGPNCLSASILNSFEGISAISFMIASGNFHLDMSGTGLGSSCSLKENLIQSIDKISMICGTSKLPKLLVQSLSSYQVSARMKRVCEIHQPNYEGMRSLIEQMLEQGLFRHNELWTTRFPATSLNGSVFVKAFNNHMPVLAADENRESTLSNSSVMFRFSDTSSTRSFRGHMLKVNTKHHSCASLLSQRTQASKASSDAMEMDSHRDSRFQELSDIGEPPAETENMMDLDLEDVLALLW